MYYYLLLPSSQMLHAGCLVLCSSHCLTCKPHGLFYIFALIPNCLLGIYLPSGHYLYFLALFKTFYPHPKNALCRKPGPCSIASAMSHDNWSISLLEFYLLVFTKLYFHFLLALSSLTAGQSQSNGWHIILYFKLQSSKPCLPRPYRYTWHPMCCCFCITILLQNVTVHVPWLVVQQHRCINAEGSLWRCWMFETFHLQLLIVLIVHLQFNIFVVLAFLVVLWLLLELCYLKQLLSTYLWVSY